MTFVDTNYFLRFFLKDNLSQNKEAKELFLKADKDQINLISSTVVFFEIYWVLRSVYKKDVSIVFKVLYATLQLPVTFEEKDILLESLLRFKETRLGLVDSYHLAFTNYHNINNLKTFDKKLLKEFEKN